MKEVIKYWFYAFIILSCSGCSLYQEYIEIGNVDLNQQDEDELELVIYTNKDLSKVNERGPIMLNVLVDPSTLEKPTHDYYLYAWYEKDDSDSSSLSIKKGESYSRAKELGYHVYSLKMPIKVKNYDYYNKRRSLTPNYKADKEDPKFEKHILYDMETTGVHHVLCWIIVAGKPFQEGYSNLFFETFEYDSRIKD